MAIPSFEENLEEARRVAEREGKAQRRSSLAPGLASFFSQLLGAGTPTQTFTGRIQPGGTFESLQQPIETGGTIPQRLGRLASGRGFFDQPTEGTQGTLLSREESIPFLFEQQKQAGRESLQTIKNRAKKEGGTVKVATQPLGRFTSDYIYTLLGQESKDKPLLTYGEANDLLRIRGADVNAELRELGYDIQIESAFLGKGEKEELKVKLEETKQKRKSLFQKEPVGDIREKAKVFLRENGELDSESNVDEVIKRNLVK